MDLNGFDPSQWCFSSIDGFLEYAEDHFKDQQNTTAMIVKMMKLSEEIQEKAQAYAKAKVLADYVASRTGMWTAQTPSVAEHLMEVLNKNGWEIRKKPGQKDTGW